jgi:hypothetical protein
MLMSADEKEFSLVETLLTDNDIYFGLTLQSVDRSQFAKKRG